MNPQETAPKLTWKQKTIIRILLIVAGMLNDDEAFGAELKALANHISAGIGE